MKKKVCDTYLTTITGQNLKESHLLLFFLLFLFFSCSQKIETEDFKSPFYEPGMIVNEEQDNTIEGKYIRVIGVHLLDSGIQIKIPDNFFITNDNFRNWVIGWGSNKPLYDAGVENIRNISRIDWENGEIFLGKLRRGKGLPEEKQRIVFWNTRPSGFYNELIKPVINPQIWPEFKGRSINFSSVQYDSTLRQWVMIINGFDPSEKNIFAAVSDNLIDWKPAFEGRPILTLADFDKCTWVGYDRTGKLRQVPFSSDVVRFQNKWYLFFHGFDTGGKERIGVAVSDSTILGPYQINADPALSVGKPGSWNDNAVFNPKIKSFGRGFIMFYDGRNSKQYEQVGMAFSDDLVHWRNSDNNPVLSQHTGWRSSAETSEPCYVEIRKDTILLMVAGAKRFKMGPWHHYITRRMYRDVSGNVDDIQLGIYLSTDTGRTFIGNKNNPVFVNDYTNVYENEHAGRNFNLIKTDTLDYLFYSAKSSFRGNQYNIMLRVRKKKTNINLKWLPNFVEEQDND